MMAAVVSNNNKSDAATTTAATRYSSPSSSSYLSLTAPMGAPAAVNGGLLTPPYVQHLRPFLFYKVVPLGETQGDIAACSVISMLLIDYFLHSATPSRLGIEGCIRDGVALYAQMRRAGAFASNRTVTYRPDDGGGQTYVRLGTNYVSPEDAYKAMRQAPWNRLQRIVQRDDITGLNIPPITEFQGLRADNALPHVVDAALNDKDFRAIMKPSLDAGIDALTAMTYRLRPGQAIGGALTVGSAAGGHVLALAVYKLEDSSVHYHLVEPLPSDPITGLPHGGRCGTSNTAAWITSSGDIGIRSYIKEAFPPINDRESLLSLYSMQEDGTGGAAFLYSITTFERKSAAVSSSSSSSQERLLTSIRASDSDAALPFSLFMLPRERMDE